MYVLHYVDLRHDVEEDRASETGCVGLSSQTLDKAVREADEWIQERTARLVQQKNRDQSAGRSMLSYLFGSRIISINSGDKVYYTDRETQDLMRRSA